MLNEQPTEKTDLQISGSLDVFDIFDTIQGEGPFSGQRALFIRLAGCNLQCPGCDTDYTSQRKRHTVLQLFTEIKETVAPPYLIVLTGGEPFRQNITPLANMLIDYGYRVQVETNGTLAPDSLLDANVVIVCSPKTGTINPQTRKRMDALKYVVHADSISRVDGLPFRALDHSVAPYVARPPEGFTGPIYIQPEDSYDEAQNKLNTDAAVNSCCCFGYILQLQIHKLVGVE